MNNNHLNRNENKESLKGLWLGIFLSVGIYFIGLILLFTLLGPLSLIVTPIAHIIVMIVAFVKGRKRLGQGLLIGFGVSVLLTAACFGIVINSLGG